MIGYFVVSFGDSELEWLFADEADAHRILVEQFTHVDNVSLERIEYGSKDHFTDEQDKYTRKRERYEQELREESAA